MTSGPVWAWCLTSGPVWASLLSFWTGLDAFHWTCVGLTCVPLGGLEKTPCQTICCLFLCAAFSFERPAPTRGLFPQEAFSHHRKMTRQRPASYKPRSDIGGKTTVFALGISKIPMAHWPVVGLALWWELSSGGKCPLTGNVLWWVFPCLCTFRPSGRKSLLVGKVLWWELSSGGEEFLELSRTSCAHSAWWGVLLLRLRPRSFALAACLSTSSAGIPSRCLQNSTGALLDRIVATPKGCTKPRTKELFGC